MSWRHGAAPCTRLPPTHMPEENVPVPEGSVGGHCHLQKISHDAAMPGARQGLVAQLGPAWAGRWEPTDISLTHGLGETVPVTQFPGSTPSSPRPFCPYTWWAHGPAPPPACRTGSWADPVPWPRGLGQARSKSPGLKGRLRAGTAGAPGGPVTQSCAAAGRTRIAPGANRSAAGHLRRTGHGTTRRSLSAG